MGISAPASRPFEPGTTGWSIADLSDPQISRQWERGAYEIVEGVLTRMPAAYYESGASLLSLIRLIDRYLDSHGQTGRFACEVDVVLSSSRVARADAVFLTPQDEQQQRLANAQAGIPETTFGRILIPPTLIIESVSLGHEAHDRQTKRAWYAQRGVPNYWIIDAYQRTLECVVLSGPEYRIDQAGGGDAQLRPALFPGLALPLQQLWPQ